MTDPETKPIVADVEKCTKAADTFISSLVDGVDNPQARYRNVAHAMALLKPAVKRIAEETRRARLDREANQLGKQL